MKQEQDFPSALGTASICALLDVLLDLRRADGERAPTVTPRPAGVGR
jgi:hypothetical protein